MDTAVFHNLAPDTNRIAHAMRGHLVALWGSLKGVEISVSQSIQSYGISLKETIFTTLVIGLLSEFI